MSCWVTFEISALRTSPRMEIPLAYPYLQKKESKCLKPRSSRLTGEKTEGKVLNFLKSENISKFFPWDYLSKDSCPWIIKIKWGWLLVSCRHVWNIYRVPNLKTVCVVKSSNLWLGWELYIFSVLSSTSRYLCFMF